MRRIIHGNIITGDGKEIAVGYISPDGGKRIVSLFICPDCGKSVIDKEKSRDTTRKVFYMTSGEISPHCKDKIPKFQNKYSQKRNIEASVPISIFMRL